MYKIIIIIIIKENGGIYKWGWTRLARLSALTLPLGTYTRSSACKHPVAKEGLAR